MAIETDALIVGAGPCGLFQVFELGLLDVSAHVVESMSQVGGQCAELYPDKPIYDIPAYPVIDAGELVERLLEQIKPFDPTFHLGQEVREVKRKLDGRFHVKTSKGIEFRARTVIIAGGVGSFQPRQLKVPDAEVFAGSQIHYHVKNPSVFHGKDLVVLGGGDSALDWALELYDKVNSLVLIHRRPEFRGAPASAKRVQALADTFKLQVLHGNVSALHSHDDRMTGIDVACGDSVTRKLDLDQLLVFWGLHPKLGPIADWGLNLHRNQIEVNTEDFQSAEPGIFAVGDINWYPGKKKLILSGFHESALAAFGVRKLLHPEQKVHLQYTTTSTKLQQRLGLKNAV
jgi:thioredoxin reductase (NADPH)